MNRIQLSIMHVIDFVKIGNRKSSLKSMKTICGLMLLLSAIGFKTFAQTTVTFNYTGNPQTWTVPAGVTSITIDAGGASGGAEGSGLNHAAGGRVQATYAVTAGTVLNIYVGGVGQNGSFTNSINVNAGGYNGGGNGNFLSFISGGGGGGATDIRIGGTALSNRVLVAGGGGGSSYGAGYRAGGSGGGTTGATGGTWLASAATGGTQSAGGLGGVLSGYASGSNGTLGIGGDGASSSESGGGGGGYYGGGGGGKNTISAAGSGGGGGSSYTDPTMTSVTHTQGYNSGNGYLNITYAPAGGTLAFVNGTPQTMPAICQNATAVSINSLLTASDNTAAETLTWTVTSAPTHGTLNGFPTTTTSVVGNSTPTGLTYTPTNGFSGTDAFTIQVSNGVNPVSTVVNVTVNPAPLVTSSPNNATICPGGNTSFTVGATGTSLTYQWQVSINGGSSYANLSNGGIYSNVTTSTLNITNATSAVNGYMYQCVVSGACTPSATSAPATLNINASPTVTVNPSNSTICNNSNTSFSVTATGVGLTYQWQVSTNGGSTYNNLTNTGIYTNVTTATLNLTNATTAVNGYMYQCVVSGTCAPSATSTGATLTINTAPTVTVSPSPSAICSGSNTSFTAAGTGTGLTYQWQVSTNGGTTYNNLTNTGIYTNVTAATMNITGATTAVSGYMYQCVISGTCSPTATTSAATLTVNPIPVVNLASNSFNICSGTGPNITLSATVNSNYAWTLGTNTGSISGGSNGSGGTINQTLSNPSNATAGSLVYAVVPTSTVGSCVGASFNITVNVNPIPALTNISTVSVCNGNSPNITLGATASSTFAWTLGTNTGGITGGSNSNGPTINQILGNPSNATAGSLVYSVVPTSTVGGCVGSASNITVTVNPTPIVTNVSTSICSGANTNLTLSATTASNFVWTTGTNTGNISGSASGSGPAINQTLLNPSNATAGSIVYIITPTSVSGSCQGSASNITMTVNPIPVMTSANSQSICSGTATNLNLTATAASNFNWVLGTNTGGITGGSNGSGSNIAQTLTNPSNATSGTLVYTVTPTTTVGSCVGASLNITETVKPLPVVSAVNNQTLCTGTPTNTIIFSGSAISGTSYSWTNSTPSIGVSASGTGTINSFLAANAGSSNSVANFSVTPIANGCSGAAQNFSITALPTPTISNLAALTQTICSGVSVSLPAFNTPVAGTSISWFYSTTGIGLQAVGTGNLPTFTTINNNIVPVSATLLITSSANGCSNSSQSLTLTVNPIPSVNAVSNQTLCNNANTSAISFSGNITGATYSWSNNTPSIGLAASGTGTIPSFTAINTGSAAVTANLSVFPTMAGCSGATQNFTITVNPTPSVSPVNNQFWCNGQASVGVLFSGSLVSGTTYNCTNSNTGVGIAASGTSGINSVNLANSGSSIQVANITVTPVANSCSGTPTTYSYTVYPTPNVASISSFAVCNGAGTGNIIFNGSVSGTSYSWSNNTASIGLGANGSGNINNFTALNGGSTPVIANIVVTPSANSCTGNTMNFNITVNPTPTANAITGQTVCNTVATAAYSFTGSAVAGTVYNWTNSNTSIGLAAGGTGNINSFNAINTGSTVQTATVTMTPAANGCTGSTQNITITVNPTPTVSAIGNQTVCNTALTNAINPAGSAVVGTTYNWTNSNTNLGLAAASGTGTIPSFTGVNNGNSAVSTTIAVTPIANSCNGATIIGTITVNPTPSVNSIIDQTVCNGLSTTAVVFGGSAVIPTTYNWTNSNTSIGLAASGTTSVNAFTVINTGNTMQTATVTVTPVSAGCNGTAKTFNINVNPTPGLTAISNQTVCANVNTAAVTLAGSTVAGTTYNWTNNNTTIGIASSGNTVIPSVSAINAGNTAQTATISAVASANGCNSATQNFTITVNPIPVANAIAPFSVCNGSPTGNINFGSNVSGSTFTWTNTNTSIGIAASGSGNINSFAAINTGTTAQYDTLKFTPTANTCVGLTAKTVITVNASPTVSSNLNQTICNGAATNPVTIGGSYAVGTVYNWTNTNTSIGLAASGSGNIPSFTATNPTPNMQTAAITVTPVINGCSGATQTFYYYVDPTLTATINISSNPSVAVCQGSPISFSSSTVNQGNNPSYQWKVNGVNVGTNSSSYTSSALNNNDVVTCVLTSNATCVNPANVSSNSISAPIMSFPAITNTLSNTVICAGTNATVSTNASGTNLSYQWMVNQGSGFTNVTNGTNYSGANTNSLSILAATTAMNGYQYKCAVSGTCGATIYSNVDTMTVKALPSIVIQPSNNATCAGGNATFTTSATGAGISYQWQVNTGSGFTNLFNSATYTGTTNVTMSIIGGQYNMNGYQYRCMISSACQAPFATNVVTLTVVQNPAPTLSNNGPLNTCVGDTTILSTANMSGYNYQWYKNGVAIYNATGSSYAVTTNGYYTVNASTTLGCNGTSNIDTLVFKTVPNPSINVTQGQLQYCSGDSVTIATAYYAGYTYQWLRANVAIPGETGTSFVGHNSGSYSVRVNNGGCVGTSSTLISTAFPKPKDSLLYGGKPVVCAGSSLILAVIPQPGNHYLWNGTGSSNDTLNYVSVHTGGTYNCYISNNDGCNTLSQTVQVIAVDTPHPSVNAVVNVLTTGSGYVNYTWQLNGINIAGANNNSYTATVAGSYTVTVKDTNTCIGSSPAYFLPLAVTQVAANAKDVSVYPNPASSFVNIDAPFTISYNLLDLSGKLMIANGQSSRIDLSGLANGVYVLQVFDNSNTLIKTIKINKNAN